MAMKQTTFPRRHSPSSFLSLYERSSPLLLNPSGTEWELSKRMLAYTMSCHATSYVYSSLPHPNNLCPATTKNLLEFGRKLPHSLQNSLTLLATEGAKQEHPLYLIGSTSIFLSARCERILRNLSDEWERHLMMNLVGRASLIQPEGGGSGLPPQFQQILEEARRRQFDVLLPTTTAANEDRLTDPVVAQNYKHYALLFPHLPHSVLLSAAGSSDPEALVEKQLIGRTKERYFTLPLGVPQTFVMTEFEPNKVLKDYLKANSLNNFDSLLSWAQSVHEDPIIKDILTFFLADPSEEGTKRAFENLITLLRQRHTYWTSMQQAAGTQGGGQPPPPPALCPDAFHPLPAVIFFCTP